MKFEGRRERESGAGIVAVAVAQFAIVSLIALAIVGIAINVASRRVGEREAIENARAVTVLKAQALVEPAITDDLSEGHPDALAAVDSVVRAEVLDDSLVRVKIWDADGRIVYSDAAELVGETYPLGDDEREALRTGRIEAEVSDLDRPENRLERDEGKLLEVYLPIGGTEADALLFEAYYRYDVVVASGSRLWRSFAPISLGGLVVLALIQLPLAWSLARRLRERMRERESLTWRALEASEGERRQIASDLHDGVVQQLTGIAYELSATARQPAVAAADLEPVAASVRECVRSLRSLVVDLTPASVEEQGLLPALRELVRRMSTDTLEVSVESDALGEEPSPVAARILYRVALEGLRNVARHAQADSALVRLSRSDSVFELQVVDNGRGFDPSSLAARAAEGHLGLRALRGVVSDAGGSLELISAPGQGTTLRVEVPAR
jgi:signal transduction histidine kinase